MRLTAAFRVGILTAMAAMLAAQAFLGAHEAAAQVGVLGRSRNREPQIRVHPPTDRLLSRGMRRAEESIARGEFTQALAFLDDLLGRPEDVFVETDAEGGFAGLKETARRLIRDLPAEGRRAYEAAFGPVAERLLRDALAAGDAAKIAQLAQRYFYTPAGYQSALILAADESDAGRHLAAALIYQQLLETPAAVRLHDPELSIRAAASWLAANEPEQAEAVLKALASRGPAKVEIAGRQHSLDATSASLDWLRATVGEPAGGSAAPARQWLTYRGNASRNGETAGGLPHMRVRWKVRLLNPYPKLEELFEEYLGDKIQAGNVSTVAGAPVAAGDYVVVRSPLGLLGVDFRTGKLVWQSERQRDPQIEQLVRSGGGETGPNAEPAVAFTRRMCDDYLYGITSSDGDRVYVIRDLPMPAARDYDINGFMGLGGGEIQAPSNRLTAYELAREGSLAWEIDGAAVGGDLHGAFFLGAPLTVGSSLFTLVEIRDDIYLAALDRTTGALQWRQQLANLETGVLLDFRRRLQAAMPSYDSGMLVCPTGAGLVVGVDLAKRSLAWAYRYTSAAPVDGVYPGGMDENGNPLGSHWVDGAATIAGGRVIVTPPESSDLHCLDLRTGRLLWKKPRKDMRRLACVHDGLVLLVGDKQLTALKLDDGKPAWEDAELELPRGAMPSGSGFVSDGKYFFPLTTSEVIAVELATGRIAARVQSRDGAPLGNLICHRGAVISQNGVSLDCFDQVDALVERSKRQLEANDKDVEALRSLGEIAYNEGRLSDAIELEERAYRQAPDDLDVREVLAECLAEALDADFAAHRAKLPLLKELEAGGALGPIDVLRIESQGLLQTGDVRGSARACLEIARSAGDPHDVLTLRRGYETLVSRWVQSQMAEIWTAASADDRASLANELGRFPDDVVDSTDGEALANFVAFFGSVPEFEHVKLALARKLDRDQRTIESQQLLLDLKNSEDAAVRREAIARIAQQLHAVAQHAQAREYDAELAGPLADEPCLDGATGRELVAQWSKAAGAARVEWPAGRVSVSSVVAGGGRTATQNMRSAMWSVRLEHGDSILGDGAGFLAIRGAGFTWLDGLGREFFMARLGDQAQQIYRQAGGIYASSRGSLLVASLGRELVAFNTLTPRDGSSPAPLWRASLGSNFDYQGVYYGEMPRAARRRPGSFRAPRMMFEDKWSGVIGPITTSGCVFQDQRRLVCVDPVTGDILWSRTDAPAGADLFGDDRFVFVTPLGSHTARVYSAIDGRALDEVRVPPWEQQLTTRGRYVIAWSTNSKGALQLAEIDPLAKDAHWSYTFAAGARVDIDRDRFIAVVEPSGRAVIIDAESGAAIADVPELFSRQPRLGEIHLSASSDSLTLAVEHLTSRSTDREVRAFNAYESPVFDGELVVLDRASGKSRWARPATVERQALVLNQPADLPFVMFAGTLQSRTRGEGRDSTTLLLIDKATGRTLYASDELPQTGAGFFNAQATDVANHEVTIDMAGRSLVVKFTSDRRPPEPPAMAEVESSAGRPSDGIFGIIQEMLEGQR